MFFLSSARRVPGPGRTLCKPVTNASNDSPFKCKRLRRLRAPKNHYDVLHFVDTRHLVRDARRLLTKCEAQQDTEGKQADGRKRVNISSTDTFTARCLAAAPLFTAEDAAIILRAVTKLKTSDSKLHLSSVLLKNVVSQPKSVWRRSTAAQLDGKTLKQLIECVSRRDSAAAPITVLEHLLSVVPSVLYQYSVSQTLQLLRTLQEAKLPNTELCERVHRKLWLALPGMDGRGTFFHRGY